MGNSATYTATASNAATTLKIMNWFDAKQKAADLIPIRRLVWNNKWLTLWRGLWWIHTTTTAARVVQNTDFGYDEFMAEDWTIVDQQHLECSNNNFTDTPVNNDNSNSNSSGSGGGGSTDSGGSGGGNYAGLGWGGWTSTIGGGFRPPRPVIPLKYELKITGTSVDHWQTYIRESYVFITANITLSCSVPAQNAPYDGLIYSTEGGEGTTGYTPYGMSGFIHIGETIQVCRKMRATCTQENNSGESTYSFYVSSYVFGQGALNDAVLNVYVHQ